MHAAPIAALRTVLTAACMLTATLTGAYGATLQISPAMVDLPPDSNASGLTPRRSFPKR